MKRVRNGSVKTETGRLIPNSDDIPGFCYVLCDITSSIQDRCDMLDLKITADKLGYFGYHKKFNAYIEVISFDRLLNMANERNKAFFDRITSYNVCYTKLLRDEYGAENVFFVPEKARWSYIQSQAKMPNIGKLIDDAMDLIEADNATLKGILPKVYGRQNLDAQTLGGLIDTIGTIALGDEKAKSQDVLGRRITSYNVCYTKLLREV